MDLATRKRKSFASDEVKGSRFVSVAFSGWEGSEAKLVAGLSSGPEQQVVVWNFEKQKFSVYPL